jgi:outer membrane protein TolC
MKKPLSLLSALLLSACVATPPTTPQVAQVKAENLGLTGAAAPHFPAEWWKAFGDPQVDRLAQHVMVGNPTLAGALARMRAAQAQLAVNQADDLPQVTLDGSEQRTLFSKNYIIPPPFGGTYHWYGSLTTNFSWNLDFWGKQAALIAQAGATANGAALDAQAAQLALGGSFAQTYIKLLLDYQNGDIADQAVAERADILKISQGRFDAGLENGSATSRLGVGRVIVA